MNPVLAAKLKAVQGWQDGLNLQAKKQKKPPVVLGGHDVVRLPRIPTGSTAIDIRLKGGWPVGAQAELYGPEQSGKSTLAYGTAAMLMLRDPEAFVLLVDAEGSFDLARSLEMGWDADRYKRVEPGQSLQEAVKIIEEALALVDDDGKSLFKLIVVDSLALLPTDEELKGDISDPNMATTARTMSRAMARLNGAALQAGTTIIWINQLREKAGFTMGNPEYTPGGKALKYAAFTRLSTRKRDAVKDGDEQIGQLTRVKVEKNKGSGQLGEALIRIDYTIGLNLGYDLLHTGVAVGIVQKLPGAYYQVAFPKAGVVKIKGEAAMTEALATHEERLWLYDAIVEKGLTATEKGDLPLEDLDASTTDGPADLLGDLGEPDEKAA